MHRLTIIFAVLLIGVSTCSAAIGFRLGAGAEIIPLKFIDLKNYNHGVGGDIRADIVWGAFSTTSLEMGYREFPLKRPWGDFSFRLHRFGFIQRFYPFFSSHLKQAPYIGVGLTASNIEGFSLNVISSDYGGLIGTLGVELPVGEHLLVDPAIRWDLFANTDWFYSGVGLSVHLVWSPR